MADGQALMRFRGSLSPRFSCKSKDTFDPSVPLYSRPCSCQPGGTCGRQYSSSGSMPHCGTCFGTKLTCGGTIFGELSVDKLRTKGTPRACSGDRPIRVLHWECSVVEASSVDMGVPSKHITGAAYVNSDKRSTAKNDGNPNSKKRKRGAAEVTEDE